MANPDIPVIDLTEEFDKTPSPYTQRLRVLQGYRKPLYLLSANKLQKENDKLLENMQREKIAVEEAKLSDDRAKQVLLALEEQTREQDEAEAERELDAMMASPEEEKKPVMIWGFSPKSFDQIPLEQRLMIMDPNYVVPTPPPVRSAAGHTIKRRRKTRRKGKTRRKARRKRKKRKTKKRKTKKK